MTRSFRYPGLIKRAYPELLRGSNWLQSLPAEERRVWASLGRITESEQGINWHALGGQARSGAAQRCPRGHLLAADGRPCRRCAQAPIEDDDNGQ